MNPPVNRTPFAAIKAAITRAFGKDLGGDGRTVAGDDLKTAFARQLGVPVLKRPEVDRLDVEHIKPNRADRRAARSGASIRANRGSDYTPRISPRNTRRGIDAPRPDVLARRARRAGRDDLAGALDLARTGAITLTRETETTR